MDEQQQLPSSDVPSPTPMRKKPVWRRFLVPAGIVVVAGGAVLTLVAASFTRVRGATRSRQLELDRRQQVIEQAIHKADSRSSDAAPSPHECGRG